MERGDLELSFVTKITSPKNLLKALAVVIFGFVPLLGASGCARDSATRNSISCHTLQIRDPDATPPLTGACCLRHGQDLCVGRIVGSG